jgi:hypothetical protein
MTDVFGLNPCFEECMHNVSRVETEDISLVNVRLGMLHSSCLQTWISRRKYCGGQRHRHVQPFRETMKVARRHWWAAVRLRDEEHARTSSADTSSKARGHAHANVPNRSAESHLKNQEWFGSSWRAGAGFLDRHRSLHSLSLEVVPERYLRVEEDHEATFVVGKSDDQLFPDVGVWSNKNFWKRVISERFKAGKIWTCVKQNPECQVSECESV